MATEANFAAKAAIRNRYQGIDFFQVWEDPQGDFLAIGRVLHSGRIILFRLNRNYAIEGSVNISDETVPGFIPFVVHDSPLEVLNYSNGVKVGLNQLLVGGDGNIHISNVKEVMVQGAPVLVTSILVFSPDFEELAHQVLPGRLVGGEGYPWQGILFMTNGEWAEYWRRRRV